MRYRYALLFLLVLILITACTRTPEPGTNTKEYTLEHDGITRTYQVHTPPSYDGTKALPVVIYLHGGGGSIKAAYADNKDRDADKLGFILVVPEGTGWLEHRALTWNSGKWATGDCCGPAYKNNVDDVGYISALIDAVGEKYTIDTKRVYATGISNGGMMSYRLACELPNKIAAVAPVAAPAIPDDCNPSRPIAVMDVQGALDPCVPIDGGPGGGCLPGAKEFTVPSQEERVAFWTKNNHCSNQTTTTYNKGEATCVRYESCDSNSEVDYCIIGNGGHTWPSGNQYLSAEKVGPVSYDMNFEQMYEFLKVHSTTQLLIE